MFLDFYGLREQPFGVTPDPAYLFPSRTHSEALASLSDGIAEGRGFFALVAEPGMGKTTLLYRLLESLRSTARTAYLFQTQCDSRELMQYVLSELGVDTAGLGLVALHNKLNEMLFSELLKGKRFVLVIDEAQNLEGPVLETIRLLSNFETTHTKLLQIVLAGQPELSIKLADPRLLQLRQRLAVFAHLQRLAPGETVAYVNHRMEMAGWNAERVFTPEALGTIAEVTRGIPRNINTLCFRALTLGCERHAKPVTQELVREASAKLGMDLFADVLSPVSAAAPMNVVAPVSAALAAEVAAPEEIVAVPDLVAPNLVAPSNVVEPVEEASLATAAAPANFVAEAAEASVERPAPAAEPHVDMEAAWPVGIEAEPLAPAAEAIVETESPVADAPAPLPEPVPVPVPVLDGRELSAAVLAARHPLEDPAEASERLVYQAFTYQAGEKGQRPAWMYPAVTIGILAVLAISIPTLLRIAGPGLARAASIVKTNRAAAPQAPPSSPYAPEFGPANYTASPSDTASGQVLTVVALPQQTLRDIALQHAGRYDDDIVKQIHTLNPQLNPDQIEAGQLIRIPLPAGTWQKSFDTADPGNPGKPDPSDNPVGKKNASDKSSANDGTKNVVAKPKSADLQTQ